MKAIFRLTTSSNKKLLLTPIVHSSVVAGSYWAPDAVKSIDVKNVGEVMKNVKKYENAQKTKHVKKR